MIGEEYQYISNTPSLTNQEGKTIKLIIDCLKKACIPFKRASSQPNLHLPLNENKLTQIFVEQIEVFVKVHPNIGVKNQYSDTFHGTNGVPDFYFHKVEEGVHSEPLMVWEAKIISASLGSKREKEYLIGKKNNGGIERFKTEKHGKGLNECGLIGFVANENPSYWLAKINSWITDLANTNNFWKYDETLFELESNIDFCFLESIVYRKNNNLILKHLWVRL